MRFTSAAEGTVSRPATPAALHPVVREGGLRVVVAANSFALLPWRTLAHARLTLRGRSAKFRPDRRFHYLQAARMSIVAQIEDTLDTIRPALREDGGDVEVVGFDDGVLQLRLVGACSACPISTMTVKQGIERRIRSAIPEVLSVQAV